MNAPPVTGAADAATLPAPVAPPERVPLVDVLRGLALAGILIVNMHFFAHPFTAVLIAPSPAAPHAPLDRAAAWLITCFFEGKFYALFATLFGFGFTIQAARARDADAFVARYCRRLTVLLGLGVAHVVLLWPGDILAWYAVIGFLLIPFLRARPRTLVCGALGAWLGLLLFWTLSTLACHAASAPADLSTAVASAPATAPGDTADDAWLREWVTRAYQVYGTGTFGAQVWQRLTEYGVALFFLIYMAPSILGYFLLGAALGRAGWLHEPAAHRRAFRGLMVWGLGIGIPTNVLLATLTSYSDVDFTWRGLAITAAGMVADCTLCLGYVGGVALLWLAPAWQPRLRPLASAGRMALSNYLLQSLVCTTLVYSYGLGWYGHISYAAGLGLALGIFALQVPLSVAWLRIFRFGPAEWAWRSLTYGRPQPLRNVGRTATR